MQGLLAPAVKLMNKLSYAQKFGVISLTFFIPFLWLSYATINQSYQAVQATKIQKNSIAIVLDLYDLAWSASYYRDLLSTEILYPRPLLTEEVHKAEKLFIRQLEVVNKEHALKDPVLNDKIAEWKTGLDRNLASSANRQSTIQDQFLFFQPFIDDMLFMASQYAQNSGLYQDQDKRIQQMMQLMMADYPSYLLSVAKARAVSTYSAIEKYLKNDTFNVLNDLYDSLDAAFLKMGKEHKSFLNDYPEYNESLGPSFSSAEVALESIRFKIDEELIAAMDVVVSWQQLNDYINPQEVEIKKVKTLVVPQIEAILGERLSELNQKVMLLSGLIVFVMITIIYLYAAFFWSVRTTVNGFLHTAQKIAKGDMRERVSVDSRDEMGQLTTEFNEMVDQIHTLIKAVHKTSSEVEQAIQRVEVNAKKSSRAAGEQLTQTEQVASAVTEMAATAEEVNHQSKDATDAAMDATNEAGTANAVVDSTLGQISSLADEIVHSTDVINKLSENSENIGAMLAVIKGIAEQTNLLALNAAIEAARAGEQGRGFAVVADEVRTLASRTQTSAQEIDEIMTTIHTGISSAVEVMGNSHMMAQETVNTSGQVREALEQIVQKVETISTSNSKISSSASEQTQVARAIDENVVKINDLGKETVEDAEHTVKAIRDVSELTASLQRKLDRFQV